MWLKFYANVINPSLNINKIYEDTRKTPNESVGRLSFKSVALGFKSKSNSCEKCQKIDNSKKSVKKKKKK